MKRKNPQVSVILPVYNGEDYLSLSIDSILNQTYENFELIIINDGSIDRSDEIILSKRDSRIVYLKNSSNQGIVKSLNKGLHFSNGEFIARMDADDISMPERLMLQHEYMKENKETDILGTEIISIQDNQETQKNRETNYEVMPSNLHNIYLLIRNTLTHPTVMIRKESLLSNNLYYDKNSEFAEDYKLWADSSIVGLKIESLAIPLLRYRWHEGQISSIKNQQQIRSSINIQFALAKFYFEDILINNNHTYLRLIKNLPPIDEEDVNMRLQLVKNLIQYNHINKIFDEYSFEKVFLNLTQHH